MYKLTVELFQYSSEKINTGEVDIDVFESLKSFDIAINTETDEQDSFGDNTKFQTKASTIKFDETNIFGEF